MSGNPVNKYRIIFLMAIIIFHRLVMIIGYEV